MIEVTHHSLTHPAVLLIEDEPRYREMLLEAVSGMGFEVRGVATGEQALCAMAQHPYGIIILDLNLPGMGGMNVLEAIRREHPAVQAVILSGFGSLEVARQAMRLDVVDFIVKPCQLDELELSLSRACTRRRRLLAPTVSGPAFGATAEPTASLDEVERCHILAAMKRHRGNRRAVAGDLGISLRTLYNRLRDYKQLKSTLGSRNKSENPDRATHDMMPSARW